MIIDSGDLKSRVAFSPYVCQFFWQTVRYHESRADRFSPSCWILFPTVTSSIWSIGFPRTMAPDISRPRKQLNLPASPQLFVVGANVYSSIETAKANGIEFFATWQVVQGPPLVQIVDDYAALLPLDTPPPRTLNRASWRN